MHRGSAQRGQLTILVLLVFLTLFVMFAFVVNIGVLISEKINLQNTADLAVYAGAAMQARVLNNIGYLNFRIRQNWKEFTFHNWVTHMRGALDHPAYWGVAAAGRNLGSMNLPYKPGAALSCICLPGTSFEGITANFCQRGCDMSFPGIEKPTVLFQSPVTEAYARASETISDKVREEWDRWKNVSRDYAQELLGRYKRQNVQFNAILNSYIQYLNEVGRIPNPMAANDAISQVVRETIGKNLSIGNYRDLQARVLLPENTETPWFRPQPIQTTALVIYADFFFGPGEARMLRPSPNPFSDTFDLGVSKDVTTVTYYALRLISKPNLIYLPEHWEPVLVAYAAAKPFGSRVGPQRGTAGLSDGLILLSTQAGEMTSPNFSLHENDTLGIKARGQLDILGNYITGAAERFNYPTADNHNAQSLLSIRAPNHFEAMRYLIFADPTKTAVPADLFAQETYPDGLEFQPDTALFPPDASAARTRLYPTNDGLGNNLIPDTVTLEFQQDPTGQKTFRTSLIQTRSSWATQAELNNNIGRTGYSVKLANFDFITSLIFSDAQGVNRPIVNIPKGDVNVENLALPPQGRNLWH